ncbi:DUF4197 domain-containing protein [Flavobacterium bizetiae]|uniref:DUF4197 domain-containing protein n=1 Tax=Flavobacterium bizetiae TaxID=2704140 RepID=A0A6J4GL33_9FLAO|nr:DUF4197 domain-containing protein [Flavobacterium bizetiae]CAA9198898.1 hypothetical protein FLA105534_02339 [Flavobacterium bizetiae]CAD5343314.1 hypothetical protein FLA105535_03312 [Flavobacterium bizetiae]CAD5349307.1 hypothetical protein FLA105534_03291 [Flavobacterium bizetiae]
MKKILILLLVFSLSSHAQVKETLAQKLAKLSTKITGSSGVDIASGLKEALNKGITEQVSKLTAEDGFYKNEAVKILMPEELQKVDATLRKVGLGSLADEGIKVMNRAAEDAVKEATPIFVSAVKNMSFTDAKNILLGNESAATTYLQKGTNTALYAKFNPVIKSSFEKVGADVVWKNIINKYNTIPLVRKVNPDLTDYTTNQALAGVFKMIAVEEKDIRTNINARTTPLLQKVFAMQDKK